MPPTSPKELLGTARAASTHWVGDGFHVRNVFPSNDLGEALSPFLLLDLAGPTDFPPTEARRGVGEHPHRGFETVTLVYRGRVEHRDSAGHAGVVGPGDVQWMTAGSGVVHEELHEREFARAGGVLQMAQLWVNLPRASKRTAPRYQDLRAEEIPEVPLEGARVRVVAGAFRGARGPAQTSSELNVWDVRTEAGAALELEVPDGHVAGVVVFTGRARVQGSPDLGEASLAWLGREGGGVAVETDEPSELILLSGVPLGEPVVSHGPFVMNTREEILEAVRDFQSGAMGRLRG